MVPPILRKKAWPGWLFYATINMSPTNTIWRDAPAFFEYITRCQSFLQLGKPDNDFLVYLPVYDMWNDIPGRFVGFDIHKDGSVCTEVYQDDTNHYGRWLWCRLYFWFFLLKVHRVRMVCWRQAEVLVIKFVPAVKLIPVSTLKKLVALASGGNRILWNIIRKMCLDMLHWNRIGATICTVGTVARRKVFPRHTGF